MPNWKKLLTSGSDASLNSLYVDDSVNATSLTGSLSFDNLTGVPTLISSSEQVTLSSTNGFTSFSSSLDSRIDTEKSRVDAILLSADADKDSFAEIVSLINSVDTTNDNTFASFYTASTGRLSSLESYTSSLDVQIPTFATTGSNHFKGNQYVTGSIEVTGTVDGIDLQAMSSSFDYRIDSISTDFADITNKPSLISSSAQITITESQISDLDHYTDSDVLSYINSLQVVSGSISTYGDSNVLSYINSKGVISGSSQITINQSQISDLDHYTNSDNLSYLNSLGVLSGSITSADIIDVDAFSQSGTYANLRAQGTTASDVGLGNVTNESKATMFTNAALTGNPTAPTQTGTDDSTKIATTAFVQGRIDAIIGTAGSTLDTLGELSASLAADQSGLAALTTTVGGKLQKDQNLSDLTNVSTARTNLGLGTAATTDSTAYATAAQGTNADTAYGWGNHASAGYLTSYTDTNYYLDGITKSGNTLTFSVNGATNQTYTFGANAFNSTTIPTNNNQLINGAGYITGYTNNYLDGITKSGNTLTFSVNGTSNQSYTFGSNAFTSYTDHSTQGYLTAHPNISAASSVNNSGNTVIQDITLDSNGHITGLASLNLNDSYYTETEIDSKLTNGTVTYISDDAQVGPNIHFFRNDGGGNLGMRFNAGPNPENSIEDGSAWEFEFANDSQSGDFRIYYDGAVSAANEAIDWTEAFKLDGGDSKLYVWGDSVWDAGDFSSTDVSNWNTAYGWGNHASAGYLAASSYTASDVLTKIKTVDGAGSGLDADLWDGNQFSSYLNQAVLTSSTPTFSGLQASATAELNTPTANLRLNAGGIQFGGSNSGLELNSAQISAGYHQANSLNIVGMGSTSTVRRVDMWAEGGFFLQGSSIYPATDNTGEIGNASYTWNYGRFTNFQVDSTLTVRSYIDLADSDGIRWGSSDDYRMFYNGSTNYMHFEMEAANNGLLYTDNGTTRFTFTKAGTFSATGDVVAYSSSDRELKDNLKPIENATDKVKKLTGYEFDWNNKQNIYEGHDIGVVAQEVEEVLPEIVATRDNGYKAVKYEKLTALLIEAIKDQQNQIEKLKEEINELKGH